MNKDRVLLKSFLEKKIKDMETNNFTEDDQIRLRDYFLHDLTNNGTTRDKDLKKYLFAGFFLFHNKDFCNIINESRE
jgi:hypothetical protein